MSYGNGYTEQTFLHDDCVKETLSDFLKLIYEESNGNLWGLLLFI